MLPAQGASDLKGTTVVFASWGGAYQDAERVCYCEPFAAATGARVVQDGPMNVAKFRAMIEGGAPDWDVADITIDFLVGAAQDGLFEKIDTEHRRHRPDRAAIRPRVRRGLHRLVVQSRLQHQGLRQRATSRTTWADLFDLKRFPGKRTAARQVVATLEIALLADGVAPDKLYPLDVDRALKKLDTIKARHDVLEHQLADRSSCSSMAR